jgi:hypothetical protein
MSLINSIIDLSFSYVKQYYDKYRKKKKVKKLNSNQIKKFSTKLYDTRKYRMINYIQTNIDKKYDINEVNKLIDEYIDDRDFIIQRLKSEIEIYQNITKK